MKRKPYDFDYEFAKETDIDIFGPHSEPHPYRLDKIEKQDLKNCPMKRQKRRKIKNRQD